MPRRNRQQSPTGIYHWIVRGIHKKTLFHHTKDYLHFKSLLKIHKEDHQIQIYHYCLMSNHVHLLIHSPSIEEMAKFSQIIQRRYAYYYCGAYKWVGSVFQPGYRSLVVDREDYLLECGRYIERNPVRAKLCKHPSEYAYSSFGYYGCASEDELVDTSPVYLGMADSDNARLAIYNDYVTEIRVQEEMMTEATRCLV
ncbi:MAG: hypothetical protein MOGMAGMI_02159 [Candidatus Omnitrophica bacterium]|nr:hypothetical protein [Candidatus Omnitrophota bacterium]